MGDRANIKLIQRVKGEERPIYLYTHWAGSSLPFTLQSALAKRWRWSDDSYLARIIFCEMVKGSEGEETGYGIAIYRPDNEHIVIEVDAEKQEVRFLAFNSWDDCEGPPTKVWSFDEYVMATAADIEQAYER